VEEHGSGVPRRVHSYPSIETQPKESQNDISWSIILPPERRQNHKENMWCA
jgi:hypothetical protein